MVETPQVFSLHDLECEVVGRAILARQSSFPVVLRVSVVGQMLPVWRHFPGDPWAFTHDGAGAPFYFAPLHWDQHPCSQQVIPFGAGTTGHGGSCKQALHRDGARTDLPIASVSATGYMSR